MEDTISLWKYGFVENIVGPLSYSNFVEAVTCFDKFIAIVICLENMRIDISIGHFRRLQLVEAAIAHLKRAQQFGSDESEVQDVSTRALHIAFKNPIEPGNLDVWHYPFLSGCSFLIGAYRMELSDGLEKVLRTLANICGYIPSYTMKLIMEDIAGMIWRRHELIRKYG